jgi:hypothetical protein
MIKLYTTTTKPVDGVVRIVACDQTGIIVDKKLDDVTVNLGELTCIYEALVYAGKAQGIRLCTSSKTVFAWLNGEVVSRVNDRPAVIELLLLIKTLGDGVTRRASRVPRRQNLAIEAIEKSKPKAVHSPGCDPPWQIPT